MAVTTTKDRNAWACLKRNMDSAWFGQDVSGREIPPAALNNEFLYCVNYAGTATVGMIRLDTSDQVRIGSGTCAVKIFNRPTTDAFALQVKSEFTDTDAAHACAEVTLDVKSNLTTGGGARGVQGVARLAATYTQSGGGIFGGYSQFCNLGTINGAGVINAAHYSVIEAGGTYTALSHLAVGWLDSHLASTVSSGNYELLYMTNNGTATMQNAFYIYAGNKITNLFTIDTASGMVSDATTSDYTFTKTRKIKVVAGGETGYLIMDIV